MKISKTLTTIRRYHCIKQQDLAEQLDISPSYLCEIEKGKKTPNLELLDKYAKIFELPPSSIIFLSEHIGSDKPTKLRLAASKLVIKMLEWSINKDKS